MASRQLSYTSIPQGFISQNMPSVAHCNNSQHPKHALLHWLICTTRNCKQSIKVHVKFFKQTCHSIAFHTRYARNSITQCINPYQPLTIPSDLPMPQDQPTKATKITFTDSQQMTASHWQQNTHIQVLKHTAASQAGIMHYYSLVKMLQEYKTYSNITSTIMVVQSMS